MQLVTASNIGQLKGHLQDAWNTQQDYAIVLSAASYSANPDTASATSNGTGFDKSSFPHIRSRVSIYGQYFPSTRKLTRITRKTTAATKLRHFYVEAGGYLRLQNLQIEKGDVGTADTGGGAIFNKGTLEVVSCILGPDNKSNYGGAVQNVGGTLTITRCDIHNNQADWGGALYNIDDTAIMTVTDTRIANNQADKGGAILNNFGNRNLGGGTILNHCAIVDNTASSGGGVVNWNNGTLDIDKSIISRNHASSNGGGFYTGFHSGYGGIAHEIRVTNSTAVENTSPSGSLAYSENTGTVYLDNVALPETYTTNIPSGNITNVLPPRYPDFTMGWVNNTGNSAQQISNGPDGQLEPVARYNRQEAAKYAVKTIRENFGFEDYDSQNPDPNKRVGVFPVGGGDLRAGVVGKVSANFEYMGNIPNHITGGNSTGSATFISECLYTGGLPMTRGIKTDGSFNQVECDPNVPDELKDSNENNGWRICNTSEAATPAWRGHVALHNFIVAIGGERIGGDQAELLYNDVKASNDDIDSGIVTDPAALALPFHGNEQFSKLSTGDYVFINQGRALDPSDQPIEDSSVQHGFLVVGWGPAVNVVQSVNARYGGEVRGSTQPISYVNKTPGTVPYVVDFAYGYNGSKTGWLQDVRPRPFYASIATISPSNFAYDVIGGPDNEYQQKLRGTFLAFKYERYFFPNWRFYHVPELISSVVAHGTKFDIEPYVYQYAR